MAPAYLVSRYFRLEDYAANYGLMIGLYGIGFGLGAVVAGALFDALGSYTAMLQGLVAVLVVGAFLIGTLGKYPDEAESQ